MDLKFLEGSGEMATRIRGFDWSRTSLGAPQSWRPSLKAMVRLALTTRHPIFIFWGAEHLCLYNDAYRALLGPEKHPAILGASGRDAWPETWPAIGPQIAMVMRGEGSTWHENQHLPIVRHGQLEDVYWTYSYGPIDDDAEATGVGGVLVVCTETTAQVLAAKRLAVEGERLARLFEQAPSFMAVLGGPRHTIELANPAFQRLVGNRPLQGMTVAQALPDAVAQGYLALLDDVYRSNQAFTAFGAEYRMQASPDGPVVERRIDVVFQPIADAAGAVSGIFIEGVDVTERRTADAALERSESGLREREEQLRLATDAADVGLWDVDMLTDTLYWPPRVKAMFGISADVPVSMADFYAGLHPDDREATGLAFEKALDERQRATYEVEYRTVGKEDGIVRWVAAKGRGVFNADGRCVRVIGTAIDITTRKANEQRLHELNETLERRVAEALAERKLLADIVEGTTSFVQVVDLGYRWLAINHASADEFERIFGVRPKVGDHMRDLLAQQPAHRDAIEAVWRRALDGEEFVSVTELGDPSLDRRHYEMRFNTLRDSDGRRIGAYQFAHDVTDRLRDQERLARAEASLRQAQKMEAVGQLTGGIAHDFNNLLQAVQGNLQLIRRVPGDADRVKQWADNALAAVKRGASLTAQLLTFAREQSVELKPVVVAALLGNMADMLARSLGPQVRLVFEPMSEVAVVLADAAQLEMALLNLALNARDAMPEGGTLSISARPVALMHDRELPPGDYVEIRATDTGCGMGADVLARAFDPFFTTKGLGKGTGLGLSQVYGMARQAGGRARIESQLGAGTTVSMWLPQSPSMPAAGDTAPSDAPTPPLHKPRVLVVDDDPAVRSFVVDSLRVLGYAVAEAADGPAGLQALERDPPDLLLVDFAMPGMNGAQVANAARITCPDLPIVFATGYADMAAIEAAAGSLVPIIRKPFDMQHLQAVLAESLGPSRRATIRHE